MENISMLFGIGKVLSISENNKTNSNLTNRYRTINSGTKQSLSQPIG